MHEPHPARPAGHAHSHRDHDHGHDHGAGQPQAHGIGRRRRPDSIDRGATLLGASCAARLAGVAGALVVVWAATVWALA